MKCVRDEDWFSPAEAAAHVRVGRRTIYKAMKGGQLKASLVNGRDFRIHRTWLLDWMTRSSESVRR
jgi:excisionase family DNA binding protein